MLLIVLPTEVQIEIAGHLVVTSKRPMDELCSLRVMCSSICRIYSDPAVGQHMVVDRCRRKARLSNDLINYFALLARLTQFDNLEACLLTGIQTVFTENPSPRPCLDYLTRTVDDGHNVAAYLVAIFLYRHNGGARNDNTVRRYIRRIEGEEESRAAMATDQ